MKKFKLKKVIIGIAIIIFLILMAIGILVFAKSTNTNKKVNGDEVFSSNSSFFLPNKEKKYALFNADGKQLTDFIFSEERDFKDGVAKVENKDTKEYGIIRENGKYLIEFGKYDYISQSGTLFLVRDKEANYKIINSKGKEVFSEEYDIEQFEYQDYLYSVSNDEIVNIVDYNGKVIDTFEKKDSDNKICTIDSDGKYGIVIFKDTAYFYNLNKAQRMFEIKNKGSKIYEMASYLDYISDEYNAFVLNPFGNEYYIYKDGNYKFSIDENTSNGRFIFFKNGLACQSEKSAGKFYIYDYDGNKIAEDVIKIKDISNYAVEKNGKITIIYNGEEKNNIDIRTSSIAKFAEVLDDTILIINKQKFTFYNLNGEIINEIPYDKAEPFLKEGYTFVKDEIGSTYIINKNNQKCSENYDSITSLYYNNITDEKEKYWIAKKDNVKYLLSFDGKKIILKDFDDVKTFGKNNKILVTYGEYVKVFDAQKNKIIAELKVNKDRLEAADNYFKLNENGKVMYYSYSTGKVFYTYE